MANLAAKLQNSLGLTATEAAIYLAALPHQAVGIAEVVKLTHVKRTTVYHALDTLAYKGLAAKKNTGRRAVFSMLPPRSLQHALVAEKQKIERQQDELRDLVPELELLQKDQLFNTQVTQYQGVAGVKAVYEEALYSKAREWSTITPVRCFVDNIGDEYNRYVKEKRKSRGIKTRALWEEARHKEPKTDYSKSGLRQVRFMPPSMRGHFRSKIIIFDNKVALINPAPNAGAILITSEDIAASFRALFETIWNISKRLR